MTQIQAQALLLKLRSKTDIPHLIKYSAADKSKARSVLDRLLQEQESSEVSRIAQLPKIVEEA